MSFFLFSTCIFSQIEKFCEKQESEELKQLIKHGKELNLKSRKNWEKLSIAQKKHLAALAFFAKIKNPIYYHHKLMNKQNKYRTYVFSGYVFGDSSFIHCYPSDNREYQILYDLFCAPFVIAGKILDVKTYEFNGMFDENIHEYEMDVIHYFNPLAKKNKGNIVKMNFPALQRLTFGKKDFKSTPMLKDNEYLVFMYSNDVSFKGLEKMPQIFITRKGDEVFPIKNGYVIDESRYFSDNDRISLKRLKEIFKETIKIFRDWRK